MDYFQFCFVYSGKSYGHWRRGKGGDGDSCPCSEGAGCSFKRLVPYSFMKITWKQAFNFRKSYTLNVAISFCHSMPTYANMVCVQFTAKNGKHFTLHCRNYFGAIITVVIIDFLHGHSFIYVEL